MAHTGQWGGRRPGAGRKSQKVRRYQERRRGALLEAVTPEDWQAIVIQAVALAKAGDAAARAWLTPWIVGAVPREATSVAIEQDGAPSLRIVIEA